MMRDLEFQGRVVCICRHLTKFRLVDSVERLISGDDPLGQQAFKPSLIPWALGNVSAPKTWTQIKRIHILL